MKFTEKYDEVMNLQEKAQKVDDVDLTVLKKIIKKYKPADINKMAKDENNIVTNITKVFGDKVKFVVNTGEEAVEAYFNAEYYDNIEEKTGGAGILIKYDIDDNKVLSVEFGGAGAWPFIK